MRKIDEMEKAAEESARQAAYIGQPVHDDLRATVRFTDNLLFYSKLTIHLLGLLSLVG
jgi:hypothetical protein